MKTQTIRLLDVVLFGPIMIVAAAKLPKQNRLLAWSLGIVGAGTIAYNGRNYLLEEQR